MSCNCGCGCDKSNLSGLGAWYDPIDDWWGSLFGDDPNDAYAGLDYDYDDMMSEHDADMLFARSYIDGASLTAVEDMRIKAMQFGDAYSKFLSVQGVAQAHGLADEWNALNSLAQAAQGKLDAAANAVRDAWGWAKSTFGLAGAKQGLNGLGILPVVPAIIAAAVAAMTYITADLLKFYRKAKLIEAGKPLPDDSGVFGSISNIAMWAALGLVAVYVAPKLLERK